MDDEHTSQDPAHPLTRAHQFFQKAAPAIRDAHEALELHGGIEGVRETVVRKADEIVHRVDEAVANATAIEGEEIVRSDDGVSERVPIVTPVVEVTRRTRSITYVQLGIVAAAATYGAIKLQRRARR
jgi:hypothetical protein